VPPARVRPTFVSLRRSAVYLARAMAAEQAFPACDRSRVVPSGLDGANGADRQQQVPMNGRCRYLRICKASG
jgi:hypothetical protein